MLRLLTGSVIALVCLPPIARAQVFPEEFKITESSGYTCGTADVSSWVGYDIAADIEAADAGKNCTQKVGGECTGRCMSSERPPRLKDFSGKIVECAPDANNDWRKCHCKCTAV